LLLKTSAAYLHSSALIQSIYQLKEFLFRQDNKGLALRIFEALEKIQSILYDFIPSTRDKNPFEKVPFFWFPACRQAGFLSSKGGQVGKQRNEQCILCSLNHCAYAVRVFAVASAEAQASAQSFGTCPSREKYFKRTVVF